MDGGYRRLALPGEPVPTPAFEVHSLWTLADVLDFVSSWSAVHRYREAKGEDPLLELASELEPIFGDLKRALAFRMPLHLRVQRLP